MKSAKGHREEEEDDDEEFGNKKDASQSNHNEDGKNNDKASATRSKHSVTEQRRRSKINERFQKLRDLIPQCDQKRDTASFLLEVIQYVQYLQEKVQTYEGLHQGWNAEPTKLMPWRNSHWRVQSFAGPPQAVKNSSDPVSTFAGRFDENNIAINPTIHTNPQNPVESDHIGEASGKSMDQQAPIQSDGVLPNPLQRPSSATTSAEGSDALNQQEELMIEGGTISLSSAYSQELLNALTQALQTSGVDLSQAAVSVQIDLGKRANRGLTSGLSVVKDHEKTHSGGNQQVRHFRDAGHDEDANQAHKRVKI